MLQGIGLKEIGTFYFFDQKVPQVPISERDEI